MFPCTQAKDVVLGGSDSLDISLNKFSFHDSFTIDMFQILPVRGKSMRLFAQLLLTLATIDRIRNRTGTFHSFLVLFLGCSEEKNAISFKI